VWSWGLNDIIFKTSKKAIPPIATVIDIKEKDQSHTKSRVSTKKNNSSSIIEITSIGKGYCGHYYNYKPDLGTKSKFQVWAKLSGFI
jgi:hypothetical protein